MIGFNAEDTKHLFFTKLDADKQIAFTEFYKALTLLGLDMYIEQVLDARGKLKIIIRVHEQT